MIFFPGAILEEDRVSGEFIHRAGKSSEENACSLLVSGSLERISIFAIIFSAESREKAWLWRYSVSLGIFQSWIYSLRYLHDLTCLRAQLNKMANVLEYRSCDCQWLSAVPCGPSWVIAVLWSYAHPGQACWGKIYKFTVVYKKGMEINVTASPLGEGIYRVWTHHWMSWRITEMNSRCDREDDT